MTIATELEPVEVRVAEVRPVPSQPDNPLFAAILTEMGGTRGWSVVMRKPGQPDRTSIRPAKRLQ